MPHDRNERRSLALHRAIAEKLRQQPELLAVPKDNLERWMREGGRSLPYLERWKSLIEGPFDELLDLIQQDSPAMTELRQSTPFAGVLEARERWKVLEPLE